MEKIGEKLYQLRRKYGLSQEQLGYEVGVSRQTISKWEQDAMQPNLDNIKMLCSVLKVDINYFISNEADNMVEEEIALTETKKKIYSNKANLILSIIFSSLFLVFLFLSIIVGLSALTSNSGYINSNTRNIDVWMFVFVLILTIVSAILSVVFIIIFTKKAKK